MAWFCLAALLVLGVPQFICAPITNDASHYDIQARTALRGGVLYRDVVEPNLPGVVWIHMTVRSVAGWSSEALRGFDCITFLMTAGLFGYWNVRGSHRPTVGIWTGFCLILVYFSVSEWCHTQRDVWQLLLVATALMLRRRQMSRLMGDGVFCRTLARWAFVEGLCLGAGVWIKPHLLIPAACVWLSSARNVPLQKLIPDAVGLLAGGLVAGGAGLIWMVSTGAWTPFLDMLLNWNPEYLHSARSMWGRFAVRGPILRLFPFSLVHVFAVPAAISFLFTRSESNAHPSIELRLLGTLYLGWCLQVVTLQNPLDYIHVVPILLGVALLALWLSVDWNTKPLRRLLGYACLVTAVALSPIKDMGRVRLWTRCLSEGSSAEVRNELAQIPYPNWVDLQRVAEFLKENNVSEGEVACWSSDVIQLYLDLELQPPTRHAYVSALLMFFPSRKREIQNEFEGSVRRFVLTNFMAGGLYIDQAEVIGPEGQLGFPPEFPKGLRKEFPWRYPIVFRSGALAVHEVPDNLRTANVR